MLFKELKLKLSDGWWNMHTTDHTLLVVSVSNPLEQYSIMIMDEDKPNVVTNSHWLSHYVDHKKHNDIGPAVIHHRNEKIIYKWCQYDLVHRDNDEPAIISLYKETGFVDFKSWYRNGTLYRENDLPQVIYYEDNKQSLYKWYTNSQPHRDSGPAVLWKNGHLSWWINGKNITKEVDEWIVDNDLPFYPEWSDEHKVMFKLKFAE